MTDRNLLSELHIDPADRDGGGVGKRWIWRAGIAGALLLIAIVAVIVMSSQTVAVAVATVEPLPATAGDVAVLDATGYVTARRQATVSSKITGKLAEVLIEEGERVNEGQVLARLDDGDELAALKLAEAQLASARAQVQEVEAQRQQAERDLKRQQDLSARGVTTIQARETAQTLVRALTGQRLTRGKEVAVAEARLRIAQVNYDNTIVRAPFSGVIVAKAAQPGEIVSPISAGGGFTRTGIGTIVDMDSLEIEVDVNEAYINRVKAKQPVIAVLDAYPDWKIPAEVIAIIPTADRSKATVKVRIALMEKDPRILPDMGVRVSFFENQPTRATGPAAGVLVPASAIVQRDGQPVVFVFRDGRAHLRAVTPEESYGEQRLVSSGLKAAERVVRKPAANLADGARITPMIAGQAKGE